MNQFFPKDILGQIFMYFIPDVDGTELPLQNVQMLCRLAQLNHVCYETIEEICKLSYAILYQRLVKTSWNFLPCMHSKICDIPAKYLTPVDSWRNIYCRGVVLHTYTRCFGNRQEDRWTIVLKSISTATIYISNKNFSSGDRLSQFSVKFVVFSS